MAVAEEMAEVQVTGIALKSRQVHTDALTEDGQTVQNVDKGVATPFSLAPFCLLLQLRYRLTRVLRRCMVEEDAEDFGAPTSNGKPILGMISSAE